MKKHLIVLIALLVALLAVAAVASATEIPGDREFIQYGEIDSVTKIGGHTVTAVEIIKEQTCTEYGKVKFYCDTPHAGDTTSSHVLYIYPDGHRWSSETTILNWGKVVKDAHCNEPGLAIDFCTVCGEENPDVSRVIVADHVYDQKHYQVVYPATCTEYGWAVHTCLYCGQWNPDDAADWKYVTETPAWGYLLEGNTNLIRLPMKKHAWTPWNIVEDSSCYAYGEAKRACEFCGATQELNVYQTEVRDQGKVISIDDVIPLKNAHWDDEVVAHLQHVDFASENTRNGAMAYIKNCQFEYTGDKLMGCYKRLITVSCPYCGGTYHDDVTFGQVFPMTAAHEWKLCEDLSTPATCTKDGENVYLCIHDDYWAYDLGEVAYHGHPYTSGEFEDPAILTEVVPATDHTWGEWTVADKYLNEKGETVVREVRACEKCHATENRVVNEGEEPVKDGLVKEDDGKWYYYKAGVWQAEYTGFVTFQGGEFWVTEGIVDTKLNGLINCPGDKWLFFAQGQVQKVTKIEYYQGQGFALKNGQLDLSANGLLDFDGGKFAFAAGRLLKEVNGIWQNPKDKVWYFLSQGQLQKYTGTATYDGATFELVDGVVVVK